MMIVPSIPACPGFSQLPKPYLILAWEWSRSPSSAPRSGLSPWRQAQTPAIPSQCHQQQVAVTWAKGLSSVFTSQPRFSPLMSLISSAELRGSKAARATRQFIKSRLPQGTGQRINMCITGQARTWGTAHCRGCSLLLGSVLDQD